MFPSFSRLVRTASVVAALTLAPAALAERAEYGRSYVFTTVDAVMAIAGGGGFEVTGILEGEATSRTISFGANTTTESQQGFGARCDRMSLLMMNRPGRFQLTVLTPASFYPTTCKLTRLP